MNTRKIWEVVSDNNYKCTKQNNYQSTKQETPLRGQGAIANAHDTGGGRVKLGQINCSTHSLTSLTNASNPSSVQSPTYWRQRRKKDKVA